MSVLDYSFRKGIRGKCVVGGVVSILDNYEYEELASWCLNMIL